MAHIYQPVMIRELLTSGGKASIRNRKAQRVMPDRLHHQTVSLIVKQHIRELGLEVSPTPGDQLAKRMRSDSDRWGKVIDESGIEKQ